MGAPAGHLSNVADVFDQSRNVAAVAVAVSCVHKQTSLKLKEAKQSDRSNLKNIRVLID